MGDLENIACTLRAIEQLLRDMRDMLRTIRTNTTPAPAPHLQHPVCNCADHTPGSLTGGWHCPAHGQRY